MTTQLDKLVQANLIPQYRTWLHVQRQALPVEPDTESPRELISAADVAFTDLEVLFTDFCGFPCGDMQGTYSDGASAVVDDLIGYGFDAFSCANNDALTLGTEGLMATLEVTRGPGGSAHRGSA